MCTIAILRGAHPRHGLIVAANRDEFYERKARAPARLGETLGGEAFYGGVDELAGGSWMGVTAGGFFVGVTNQRALGGRVEGRRSRGEVVLAALRSGSGEGVEAMLRGLDGGRYNPFNLVFGDQRGVRVAYVRDDPCSVEVQPVDAGLAVLANDRIGSPEFPKTERMRELLAAPPLPTGSDDDLVARLASVLRDREVPERKPEGALHAGIPEPLARALQALCVETPVYGTVSSTILLLGEGRVHRYLYASASPRAADFEDVAL